MKRKIFFKTELIANIVPVMGVLFFGWSALSLLLVYWMENMVIGLYQVVKIFQTRVNYPTDARGKMVPGPLRPVKLNESLALAVFFCLHYGGFTFGHFLILGAIGDLTQQPLQWHWGMALTVLSFLYVHGISYRNDFVLTGGYKKIALSKLFIGPYRRILITHVTLVLGGFPVMVLGARFPRIAVILVLLKIFIDVKSQRKENELWGTVDKLQQPPFL